MSPAGPPQGANSLSRPTSSCTRSARDARPRARHRRSWSSRCGCGSSRRCATSIALSRWRS